MGGDGDSFDFYNMRVCFFFTSESPHQSDSNKYIQNTIFNTGKKNHSYLSKICKIILNLQLWFFPGVFGAISNQPWGLMQFHLFILFCLLIRKKGPLCEFGFP